MTTITDSVYGASSQYLSSYRSITPGNHSQTSLTQQSIYGGSLQKLLTTLDNIETAVSGFQSRTGNASSSTTESQPIPATSARLQSTEEINAATPNQATENIVNPSNAFNGTDSNSPNFENGAVVSEGSFLLNGVEIHVSANSSIYSVLSSVNASRADVTAFYNSRDEQVVLTHNRLGAASTIELSNDSSGFLTATKLDNATVVKGSDAIIPQDNTLVKPRSYRTADMLDALNDNLAAIINPSAHYQSTSLRVEIQKVVENMHANFGERQLKEMGIEFSDANDQLLNQSKSARRRLVHALQDGDHQMLTALSGTNDSKQGLIPLLRTAILEHIDSADMDYRKGSLASFRA